MMAEFAYEKSVISFGG